MLRPAPMKKIVAVIHKSRKDEILKEIKERGVVEIRDVEESEIFRELSLERGEGSWVRIEASELISKIDSILDVLRIVIDKEPKIDSLGEFEELIREIPADKKKISKAFEQIAERLFFLEDKVSNLSASLNETKKDLEEFESYKGIVDILSKFNLGPSDLRGLVKSRAFLGTIPKEELAGVEEELNSREIPFIMDTKELDKKKAAIILITLAEHEADVARILRIKRFEEIGIPIRIIPYTLEEATEKIQQEIKELREEEKKLLREIEEISREELENLLRYREFLSAARQLDEVNFKFGTTRETYMFQGWVPAEKAEEVKNLIIDLAKGEAIVQISSPSHEDTPPTLMRNPKITKPLEVLTTAYGYPEYNELDPTSVIAITFPVIFGFMFGDIGHGLVVALLGYILGFRLKAGERVKKLGRTLLMAGTMAFIVGWLYGSFFGLEGEHMQHYLGFTIEPLWMNPMANIQDAVLFSLKFGVVLLSIGLVLNIIKLSMHKEYAHALTHPYGFAGLWFFLGSVALLYKYGLDFGRLLGSSLSVALLYLPLIVIIIGEWKFGGESLGMSAFNTFFEVALKYLANGLSFVRISILALVHAGLASMMVLGMDASGIGWPIIFLIGNVVIIVMEMFISFIHDLRLHFYEIFSKFYSGRGTPFNPLKISFRFLERE